LPKGLITVEHGSEIANIAKIADITKIVKPSTLKHRGTEEEESGVKV
jgi:hypothetical protein